MPQSQLTEMQFRALVETARKADTITKTQEIIVNLYYFGVPQSPGIKSTMNMAEVARRARLKKSQTYNLLDQALGIINPLIDNELARMVSIGLPENNDVEKERYEIVLHQGNDAWADVDTTLKGALTGEIAGSTWHFEK